jgi:hypothetical protein
MANAGQPKERQGPVAAPDSLYEIRCPVHGFITLDDWEWDVHLKRALAEMLPEGVFSRPDEAGLDDYLRWDDWRVLGELANGAGGEHGRRLAQRDHFRKVYHTPDSPSRDEP